MARFLPVSLVALALALGPSPVFAAVDLVGTWFVLIHYRDSMTANPDSDRWEDKVWKIEQKGSRLQWSEFPIVHFNDGSGRFGRVGRNNRARLMHKWEPNESQMAEIVEGPQVNSRGSKKKSLRGSPKRGYKSSSASRSTSALTVGYQETWSIDEPSALPVFTRDDALGTESALATKSNAVVSGRTRYATLEVSEDGNLLTGTYVRDENKKGTFKLIRAGDARGLETDGRTPNQKQGERIRQQVRQGMQDAAYAGFLQTLGDEQVRDLRNVIGEQKLSEVWSKYEMRIIAGDQRARVELGDDLREIYIAVVQEKLEEALLSGDPNALLDGQAKGMKLDSKTVEMLKRVRETLGEKKLAALRAQYADKIKAGDEAARESLRSEIREAYVDAVKADFMQRLNAGDSEAVRQMREEMRKQRDRR
ncbi:MAG: hypothetical protein VX466_12075 [Myxococcota bacterium]|nr:hypothetical protein [Myxococcota bacterium]